MWTREEAVDLCKKIEAICPKYGCHVALTGGTLYKDGPRKDCDILLYRIRQSPDIDFDGLFNELGSLGLKVIKDHGFVSKATYNEKPVDFLFPEFDGEYYEGACVPDEVNLNDEVPL